MNKKYIANSKRVEQQHFYIEVRNNDQQREKRGE